MQDFKERFKSAIKPMRERINEKTSPIIYKTDIKLQPIRDTVRSINTFFIRHFVFTFIILLIICCIVNWIWFCQMDPNGDPNEMSYNRTIITKTNADGTSTNEFISSSFADGVYFTFTSFSTIGYGDITPKTSVAKSWTIFMQTIVILFSYKLFEFYMNVDKNTNESALYNAYEQERNENIKIKKELASTNERIENIRKNYAATCFQKVWREKQKGRQQETSNKVFIEPVGPTLENIAEHVIE